MTSIYTKYDSSGSNYGIRTELIGLPGSTEDLLVKWVRSCYNSRYVQEFMEGFFFFCDCRGRKRSTFCCGFFRILRCNLRKFLCFFFFFGGKLLELATSRVWVLVMDPCLSGSTLNANCTCGFNHHYSDNLSVCGVQGQHVMRNMWINERAAV